MKFFTSEDFNCSFPAIYFGETMANIANAKLEREGKVVYGMIHASGEVSFDSHSGLKDDPVYTKQALLINIEPNEKCTHPKEKIHKRVLLTRQVVCQMSSTIGKNPMFMAPIEKENGVEIEEVCECGVKVQPKEFEEIK